MQKFLMIPLLIVACFFTTPAGAICFWNFSNGTMRITLFEAFPDQLIPVQDFQLSKYNQRCFTNNLGTVRVQTDSGMCEMNVDSSSEIKIFDVLGREVATLVDKPQPPGNYKVTFNASALASGVYFYRLKYGSFVQSKKMMLLK